MVDPTVKQAAGPRGRIVNDQPLRLRWSLAGKLQYARHWHDLDTGLQGHEWIDVPTEEVASGAQEDQHG